MVQGFLGGLLGSLLGRPGPLSFLLGVVGGVYLEQTYAIPDLRREAERCVPPPPGVPPPPPARRLARSRTPPGAGGCAPRPRSASVLRLPDATPDADRRGRR